MGKEVTIKKEQAVSTEVNLGEWGIPEVMSSDILIPKILPMQPLSELVTDDKALAGEFRDSVSGEKLAGVGEAIEVIPFAVNKVWDEYEEKGTQYEWVKSYPLEEHPAKAGYNDLLPWQDKNELGVNIKRVRRMNFFVLRPKDIANGGAIPFILSFKSMSFIEGKKMFSQMYMRNLSQKLPPPAFTFNILNKKDKNDKGVFYVPTVSVGRRTTDEELTQCLNWYKIVNKGGVRVDESDVQAAEKQQDQGTGDY